MSAARSMLSRVQRLEAATHSPWDTLIGPLDQFEADTMAGVADGKIDARDGLHLIECIKRWVREF